MAKTKNKERQETEYLRGIIRGLRAEVKRCKKAKNIPEDIEPDEQPAAEPDPIDICQDCGKGTLRYLDLVHVQYKVCELCGIRIKLHGIKKETK